MDEEQGTLKMIERGPCLERVLVGKVDSASTRCHHEDVHDVRCHVTKQMTSFIILFFYRGDFKNIFYVLYSTMFHLPPLRFHSVGGCWERILDCCDFGIGSH
jgi:hypothetical protein